MEKLIMRQYKHFCLQFVFILCILFLAIDEAKAQKKIVQQGDNYKEGKISVKGGQPIKAKNIKLINDTTIGYQNYLTGNQEYISTQHLRWVSVRTGSHAGTYALLGGLTGLLTALSVDLQISSDPYYYYDKPDMSGWYVGLTAGGALIGALIGASTSKWETRYLPAFKKGETVYVAPKILNGCLSVQFVYRL